MLLLFVWFIVQSLSVGVSFIEFLKEEILKKDYFTFVAFFFVTNLLMLLFLQQFSLKAVFIAIVTINEFYVIYLIFERFRRDSTGFKIICYLFLILAPIMNILVLKKNNEFENLDTETFVIITCVLLSCLDLFIYNIYKDIQYRIKKKEKHQVVPKANNYTGFRAKENILTPAEKRFYFQLKKFCDKNRYVINCKTRLEDIIETVSDGQKRRIERSKIKSRHIDFAILDENLNYLFCIELDDSSHNDEKSFEGDGFKNYLFETTGLKLYRVKVQQDYTEELRKIFR